MKIEKLVFVGAGAIGGSVAAWAAEGRENVYCYDRPEVLDILERDGIAHYDGAPVSRHIRIAHGWNHANDATLGSSSAKTVRVGTMRDLSALGENDVLLFCVKNYSLDGVARLAAANTGGRPFAVSLANGLDNQSILPRHFGRCAYGVVGYNAWLDGPGRVGWQSRGPLVLGTPDNSLRDEVRDVAAELGKGLAVSATDRLGDAAHSKLVVNLVNTITTLVGLGYSPIEDLDSLQTLVTKTLAEGARVAEKAGYREFHVGEMPGFGLIKLSAALPRILSRATFVRNMKKMVKSSMSQDVFQRGRTETELESLTGYIVGLAKKVGMAAPWNEGLYRIALQAFAETDFRPFAPKALIEAIRTGGMPRR